MKEVQKRTVFYHRFHIIGYYHFVIAVTTLVIIIRFEYKILISTLNELRLPLRLLDDLGAIY
jgi:hypothetical protein